MGSNHCFVVGVRLRILIYFGEIYMEPEQRGTSLIDSITAVIYTVPRMMQKLIYDFLKSIKLF